MKFHFNEVALRHTAQSRLPDREGRLLYRSAKGAYKERWFRLHGNLLFYFRTNDFGAVSDHDPVGVFVLAKYSVEMEEIADRPFVFTMAFEGEEGRKHYFSGQTMQQCLDWISALQRNSYEVVRSKYESLRREVYRVTGKDPVKEKMALSSKPKLRPESRQTKFYYDSGVDSVDSLISTRSSSLKKSVRPSELQNSKPTEPSKLDFNVKSKEGKLSPDNALITMSPDDVQKGIVGDQVSSVNPVLQFDIADAIPAIRPVLSTLEQSSGMQQTVPMISLAEPTRLQLLQPVAFRQGLSPMPVAQQNMARGPVMPFGTILLAQSGMARMPRAIPPSAGGHALQQNVPHLTSGQPIGTQWRQYGTASLPVSFVPFPSLISGVNQNLATAIRSDFGQQPSAGVDNRMDANSFSAPRNFQSSALTSRPQQTVAPESSGQNVKKDDPYRWRPHEMNKSHTSPELMSFHKWEKFDE